MAGYLIVNFLRLLIDLIDINALLACNVPLDELFIPFGQIQMILGCPRRRLAKYSGCISSFK
jgi:hypothetical protein